MPSLYCPTSLGKHRWGKSKSAKDTRRPSTSSTRASHSQGQCAAPHQVVNRLGPPPPPHAAPALEFPPPPYESPALEFLPPPHASSSPEIPPRTAHAVPDLETPLLTTNASSHPEIPSHTPHTFFDPAYLSFTPPYFDLGYDFSQTPSCHAHSIPLVQHWSYRPCTTL